MIQDIIFSKMYANLLVKIKTKDVEENKITLFDNCINAEYRLEEITTYNITDLANKLSAALKILNSKFCIETDLPLEHEQNLKKFLYVRLPSEIRSDIELSALDRKIVEIYDEYISITSAGFNEVNQETFIVRTLEFINRYTDQYTHEEIKIDSSSTEFNNIMNVNKGSIYDARILKICIGADSFSSSTVLIGKTVVFDTGGLNIKTFQGMLNMNQDMMGGALVIASALCSYLIYGTVTICLLPIVENAVGSRAYKQQDIIQSYGGNKIIIKHTDCEGRLILFDMIEYACKNIPFQNIMTVATLTGSVVQMLGEEHAGFITNNDSIRQKIADIKSKHGEYLHELPNHSYYDKHLENIRSAIPNIGTTTHAGAIIAGRFLQKALDQQNLRKYTHIDIAGYIDFKAKYSAMCLLEFMSELIAE